MLGGARCFPSTVWTKNQTKTISPPHENEGTSLEKRPLNGNFIFQPSIFRAISEFSGGASLYFFAFSIFPKPTVFPVFAKTKKNTEQQQLVGGFNPFEKY